MKIKDIPAYVLTPYYKMTHIIVAEVENGLFQYRQCLSSKGAAVRRLNQVRERFPQVHFEMVSLKDINKYDK